VPRPFELHREQNGGREVREVFVGSRRQTRHGDCTVFVEHYTARNEGQSEVPRGAKPLESAAICGLRGVNGIGGTPRGTERPRAPPTLPRQSSARPTTGESGNRRSARGRRANQGAAATNEVRVIAIGPTRDSSVPPRRPPCIEGPWSGTRGHLQGWITTANDNTFDEHRPVASRQHEAVAVQRLEDRGATGARASRRAAGGRETRWATLCVRRRRWASLRSARIPAVSSSTRLGARWLRAQQDPPSRVNETGGGLGFRFGPPKTKMRSRSPQAFPSSCFLDRTSRPKAAMAASAIRAAFRQPYSPAVVLSRCSVLRSSHFCA
jgi:hypothetical protein